MKNLVIVGATGMVGGDALQIALDHPRVSKVTSVGRRPTGVKHPKLNEVICADFADCSAIEQDLRDQDGVVFCLGTYTGTVSDDEMRKITVDYTEEFARVTKRASPDATFCFLSGMGADQMGKSRAAFARDKGAAEKLLEEYNFGSLRIFRPGYIYPVKPRSEPNFSYRLLRWIYPVFHTLFPRFEVRSDELARAMVNAAIETKDAAKVMIYENKDIKALLI